MKTHKNYIKRPGLCMLYQHLKIRKKENYGKLSSDKTLMEKNGSQNNKKWLEILGERK